MRVWRVLWQLCAAALRAVHSEDVILQLLYGSMRMWRVLWQLCAAALRAVHSEDVILQLFYESMRVWRGVRLRFLRCMART